MAVATAPTLGACGGSDKPARTASTTANTTPTKQPRLPPRGDEFVYRAKRPAVSPACHLVRLGKAVRGPRGAHWLITPPVPAVRARRHGHRVSVRWSFARIPHDCRPGFVELNLRSHGPKGYFAGGTDRGVPVNSRRGRRTFRVIATPKGPPYVLLTNTLTSDGRIPSRYVRTRVP